MCFTYAKFTEKNIKEREANHEQKISTRVVFLGTNKLILFVFLTLMLIFKLFDFWYNHAMIILRNERCMGHVAQFWECIDLCFFTTPFDLDLLFLVYCVLFLHFDLVVYFFILFGFISHQSNCYSLMCFIYLNPQKITKRENSEQVIIIVQVVLSIRID